MVRIIIEIDDQNAISISGITEKLKPLTEKIKPQKREPVQVVRSHKSASENKPVFDAEMFKSIVNLGKRQKALNNKCWALKKQGLLTPEIHQEIKAMYAEIKAQKKPRPVAKRKVIKKVSAALPKVKLPKQVFDINHYGAIVDPMKRRSCLYSKKHHLKKTHQLTSEIETIIEELISRCNDTPIPIEKTPKVESYNKDDFNPEEYDNVVTGTKKGLKERY